MAFCIAYKRSFDVLTDATFERNLDETVNYEKYYQQLRKSLKSKGQQHGIAESEFDDYFEHLYKIKKLQVNKKFSFIYLFRGKIQMYKHRWFAKPGKGPLISELITFKWFNWHLWLKLHNKKCCKEAKINLKSLQK